MSLCGLLVLPAVADSLPVWEGDVYSSGVEVLSSPLNYGVPYRVVTTEVWLYDNRSNLAADAMYYTDSYVDTVFWADSLALVGGGSFLQINGQNVSWGPFSNGNSGNHTYTIYYTGTGDALTFRIRDWVDLNYNNNFCHLHVRIYSEVTVGGRLADVVPSGLVVGFVVGAVAFAAMGTAPVIRRRGRVLGEQ